MATQCRPPMPPRANAEPQLGVAVPVEARDALVGADQMPEDRQRLAPAGGRQAAEIGDADHSDLVAGLQRAARHVDRSPAPHEVLMRCATLVPDRQLNKTSPMHALSAIRSPDNTPPCRDDRDRATLSVGVSQV